MKAEHIKEFQALDEELSTLRGRLAILANSGSRFRVLAPEMAGDSRYTQDLGAPGDYGARVRVEALTPSKDAITALRAIETSVIQSRIDTVMARQKELDR